MNSRFLLIVMTAVLAGCSPEEESASADVQRFEVRGFVRGVEPGDDSLTIEHEEIPDYMASMTMPFNVRNAEEIEGLEIGDAIVFEFVVAGEKSWIQDLKPVDPATVTLPEETRDAPVATASPPRVEEGDPLPDFELIDQRGRTIDNGTFEGRALLVTFIFTRCAVPDFCPLMSRNFATLEDEILSDGGDLASEVRMLSVSFDPEYDTPEVLADYAGQYSEDGDFWRFASGDKEEIDRLTGAFRVFTRSARGTIDHSLCTALVDADGVIRSIWRGNVWKTDEVMSALRDLLASGPSTLKTN